MMVTSNMVEFNEVDISPGTSIHDKSSGEDHVLKSMFSKANDDGTVDLIIQTEAGRVFRFDGCYPISIGGTDPTPKKMDLTFNVEPYRSPLVTSTANELLEKYKTTPLGFITDLPDPQAPISEEFMKKWLDAYNMYIEDGSLKPVEDPGIILP